MNLFYQPLIRQGVHHLDAEESRHCVKVLRKRSGDIIQLTDGKGTFYTVRLLSDDPSNCSFEIVDSAAAPVRDYNIHVAISPTKNADRIEWFVEKAVEFGIDEISLIDCHHTERVHQKTERLVKVAISGMKQSLKATLPLIHPVIPVSDFLQRTTDASKFIAYVDNTNPYHLRDLAKRGDEYVVLIGPEGDFTSDELKTALNNGYQKVSLGNSRLRTETAGVAACHILNLINS